MRQLLRDVLLSKRSDENQSEKGKVKLGSSNFRLSLNVIFKNRLFTYYKILYMWLDCQLVVKFSDRLFEIHFKFELILKNSCCCYYI